MPLESGSRLGPYEIIAPLGAGGMGEVYRARDPKLGRDVALKLLPNSFVHDSDRVARFQREAQMLAALNHPHIAAIYGLDESDTSHFLVLELVEGETLADKLRGAPHGLPVAEALALARQTADALEAAHDKGIVHRDLKPANIAITEDGRVKVLDFGLAKDVGTSSGSSAGPASLSPTLTLAATQAGVILGTAAYMSPEQAKGRTVDKRTDVWAFGCVLFETLTGKRAFEGDDVTDTIAAIVRGEPDWSALPADTPDHIRLLLKRCLEKDRKARVSDIAVARFVLTEPMASSPAGAPSAPGVDARSGPRAAVGAVIGLLAGIAVTVAAVWGVARLTPDRPTQTSRFTIVPPSSQPLNLSGGDRVVTISPDGSRIVYRAVSQSQSQLFVRQVDQLDAKLLAGASDPRYPFISPDNQWIGFFSGGELKKISMSGGSALTLCQVSGAPRGATWGPDDTVIFATSNVETGLMRVAAGGGEPKVLTKPDHSRGEADHLYPSALPDGKSLLFTIGAAQAENYQVAVLDVKTVRWKVVLRGATVAEYVPTGHLVYATAGSLRAVRFDLAKMEVLGDPVPIVDQVVTLTTGAANFGISRTGSLVYVPGTISSQNVTPRSLVWVDRQGREEPLQAPLRAYTVPRISPDGTRLALDIRDQRQDIWIWDLARRSLTPLTFDAGVDMSPVWTPDGRRLIWASTREAGIPNLYSQPADGTGAVERLTTTPIPQFPTSITPDATQLLLFENSANNAQDVMQLRLDGSGSGSRRTEALIHTAASEVGPEISPDGRFLAYQSNESGQPEVYVRPFPNIDGGRWQVSTAGGTRPAWARNGRELFYLDATGLLTRVLVTASGSTFVAGNPVRVLSTRYYAGFTTLGLDLRGYDVSADGRRFLMIKDAPADPASAATPVSMVVVLNWFEELKARVR